jgi:hypothetical protein
MFSLSTMSSVFNKTEGSDASDFARVSCGDGHQNRHRFMTNKNGLCVIPDIFSEMF